MTDGDHFEKTMIFGGITHSVIGEPKKQESELKSSLRTPASKIKSPASYVNSPSKSYVKSQYDSVTEEVHSPIINKDHVESSHLSNDLYILEVR